jgi:dethiobiotin synthetase
VLGLVLNGPLHPDNPRTLESIGRVPVLAELPPLEPLTAEALQRRWLASRLPSSLSA